MTFKQGDSEKRKQEVSESYQDHMDDEKWFVFWAVVFPSCVVSVDGPLSVFRFVSRWPLLKCIKLHFL